jgi:hypothetical protein
MENLLTKPSYELWANKTHFKVFITSSKLCNGVNKVLSAYPGYRFQEGEEAVFNFTRNRTEVLEALGLSKDYISALTNLSLSPKLSLESTNADGVVL